MKLEECDINKVTPMMRQYMEIKLKNKNIILFYRLGDFYEMFFEDAIIASRELELTLTGKNAGLDEKIPMCGVPHHASFVYIEKLVEKGYKVGICEQLEDPKASKGIVKRDITQIISKGTIINNDSLLEYENNYIGSVLDFKDDYILSYADISTGEIYTLKIGHNQSKLVSEKTEENFSKEDKDKLIEYFKEDEEYRSLFLQILNNDRAKGGEIFNKNIFLYMGEIFENINDLVLEKNDYRFFKYVSIISMTYFITEKNKKRYLFEFIKDNNKLKFMDFWKKYSKFVVELDMENDITKKELITEQSTKTKYKFAAFSNTLTIVNNMVNFGFDKNFIHEFINFAENNYSLSKEQIRQIEDLMVVWSSNTDTSNNKSDDNDNNKETNKDEVDSNDKDKYEDMK